MGETNLPKEMIGQVLLVNLAKRQIGEDSSNVCASSKTITVSSTLSIFFRKALQCFEHKPCDYRDHEMDDVRGHQRQIDNSQGLGREVGPRNS
jgi:hypothetical protein